MSTSHRNITHVSYQISRQTRVSSTKNATIIDSKSIRINDNKRLTRLADDDLERNLSSNNAGDDDSRTWLHVMPDIIEGTLIKNKLGKCIIDDEIDM